MDTSEDITRQFENQTQYDNDLTLTEAMHVTDMKDNLNTKTDSEIDRTADNEINGEPTDPPQKMKTAKQTHNR